MKGDEIVRACDRLSNKVATLREHVTIYKKHEKWIFEFLANLRVVTIKLLDLTEFASPDLSIYFNFVLVLGSVVMLTFLS